MLNRFKIGIFDSGIGGLTVAKAISNLCPNENLLYIGDTAHMPWGDKSKSHIVYYATKITEFLIKNGCNIIVIACNTASANALTEISEQFNQIKLFLRNGRCRIRIRKPDKKGHWNLCKSVGCWRRF